MKVLVTSDFSANSKAGIRFAFQFQNQTNCDLVFYHVVQIMKPTSWSDKKFKQLSDEKIKHFTQKLIDFVSAIKKEFPLSKGQLSYKVEISIHVENSIQELAKKAKCQFICMATKGAGRIQQLFGTTASHLINNSATPVMVIPGNYKPSVIKTIFYASDFSNLTQEMKPVTAMADTLNANLNVYHFDYMIHVPERQKQLQNKAAKYISTRIKFHFRRQEIEKTLAQHLKKEIGSIKPDLLVLFTKTNKNWFERLFPSGESKALAFNTKYPLLVYRKK